MNQAARPPVRLNIERVVLDGVRFNAAEAAQFQALLVRELTTLLRAGGLPADIAGGAVPRVAAQSFVPPAMSQPAPLARAIAASVYQSLGRAL
jgi:hypothetical protein